MISASISVPEEVRRFREVRAKLCLVLATQSYHSKHNNQSVPVKNCFLIHQLLVHYSLPAHRYYTQNTNQIFFLHPPTPFQPATLIINKATTMSFEAQRDIYLVIGGSGFLGHNIVKKILAQGDPVSVLDIVQRHHDAPFYSGNICVQEDVVSAIQKSGATCIIHTASPPPDADNAELFQKVNVLGTKTIIAAARQTGLRRLVYTSSAGVVFTGTDLAGVDETYPLPPPEGHFQVYNKTKAEAEQDVLEANDPNGLLTCALRPAGIFGPGDQLMISTLYQTYQRGQSRVQLGDNTNLFDYTYVENVADAHLVAAAKLRTNPTAVAGQAFFITNDEPVRFWDFIGTIHSGFDRYTGQDLTSRQRIIIPRSLSYILAVFAEIFAWISGKKATFTRMNVTYSCATRWYNIEKAKRVLGYVPNVKLYDGLNRTMEWWAEEHGFAGAATSN
jgi:sterol-4alpha-carboxylate 3-dehydrogenase (decarboxylating)